MNTKTMEGLIGAGANMKLTNTPMKVFREARRKGDTATMERAMGYANEFSEKAENYRAQADEGTREEAEKAREEAKMEREKAVEKRREEREKLTEEIAAHREERRKSMENISDTPIINHELSEGTPDENRNAINDIADTLEISSEGKILSEKQPVNYAKSGTPSLTTRNINISVTV